MRLSIIVVDSSRYSPIWVVASATRPKSAPEVSSSLVVMLVVASSSRENSLPEVSSSLAFIWLVASLAREKSSEEVSSSRFARSVVAVCR